MTDRADGADELLAARRHKLESLRDAGIDPFPHEFDGVEPIASVREEHADLSPGDETEARHRVAGRLAARRGQGKMAFLDLVDRSGRIQLQARVDELGPEGMDRLLGLDLGDLIGVDGTAFMSRRGELTLRVLDFTLLAKSLRPPPEKHHGLTDVETRFRRRELDLIANEEARDLFITRARVISAVRRFLDAEGFIEVETPVLQPLYGGALARPFTTHFNALEKTMPDDQLLAKVGQNTVQYSAELGRSLDAQLHLMKATAEVFAARLADDPQKFTPSQRAAFETYRFRYAKSVLLLLKISLYPGQSDAWRQARLTSVEAALRRASAILKADDAATLHSFMVEAAKTEKNPQLRARLTRLAGSIAL